MILLRNNPDDNSGVSQMKKEMCSLLNEVCIDLGFCVPAKDEDRILAREYIDANQFANEIFLAEGMDKDMDRKLWRMVKERFTRRFGDSLSKENFQQTDDSN